MDKQGVLTREEIFSLCSGTPPLVAGAVDLDEQVQPNGIDLTLREVSAYVSRGSLPDASENRVLSKTELLSFDGKGGIDLLPGAYLVTFNEVVTLPDNVMALARPLKP